MHVALSHQIKVVVLVQIIGQIERVQGIAVSIVFATYVESFVPELLSGAGKQTFVSSYIQSVRIVRLYGFQRKLLLSIQIQCNLTQVIVLEVERITFEMAVKCPCQVLGSQVSVILATYVTAVLRH